MDMSQTIIPKSDQLNADDLISGPITVKVTRVSGNEGTAEQPVNIYFDGDNGKPFRPCKTMRRVLVECWGADGSKYAGRSMTLFRDPKVKWGGIEVGGIRISHVSHIDAKKTMALTVTRSQRRPYVVEPLQVASSPEDEATVEKDCKLARTAAGKGAEYFRGWWNKNKDRWDNVRPIMEELQSIAAKADASGADTSDEDPFANTENADVRETPDNSDFIAKIERRLRASVDESDINEMVDQYEAEFQSIEDSAPEDAEAINKLIADRRKEVA